MNNPLQNWKTSSLGLVAIVASLVHLVFAFVRHTADEQTVTTALITIITGGIGLFARDSSQSAKALADIQAQIDKHTEALKTGDTSILTKSQAASKGST
jgi:hypothetical protein